jgi:hypothetical protein
MKHRHNTKTLEWLQTAPSLEELCLAFPKEWEIVQNDLAEVFARGNIDELHGYLKHLSTHRPVSTRSRGNCQMPGDHHLHLIRKRMAQLVIKQHCISVASGVEKGKVRFNLLNGFIAQKLLFYRGLERKPVSLFWFRLIWPLIWQKRFLMPLVQPEGIYCFYSDSLVKALTEMIGSRTCLEIAAGDGTLSRFLKMRGVGITATDDHSWGHSIQYPEWVIKRDARESLSTCNPGVVICSWPPANNNFERHVFKTRSVQLYIVISSRHRSASGNWMDYQQQTTFTFEEDKKLSSLVLPPELDAAVYVFRKKADLK